MVRPDSTHALAGQWSVQENIAVQEARALLRAVWTLPQSEERCRLRMMVDNTTVVGSVRRTRCSNYIINNIVGQILALAGHTMWQPLRCENSSTTSLCQGRMGFPYPK